MDYLEHEDTHSSLREFLSATCGAVAMQLTDTAWPAFALVVLAAATFLESFWVRRSWWGWKIGPRIKALVTGLAIVVLLFFAYKILLPSAPYFTPELTMAKNKNGQELIVVHFLVFPAGYAGRMIGQMDDRTALDPKVKSAAANGRPLTSLEQREFVQWYHQADIDHGQSSNLFFAFPATEVARHYSFGQKGGPSRQEIRLFRLPGGEWSCYWETARRHWNWVALRKSGVCPLKIL